MQVPVLSAREIWIGSKTCVAVYLDWHFEVVDINLTFREKLVCSMTWSVLCWFLCEIFDRELRFEKKRPVVQWLLDWITRRKTGVCFQLWYNPLWLTGLKAQTNRLTHVLFFFFLFFYSLCCGISHICAPPQGELRTQKLKSLLVRTQSLNVLPLKPRVGQYITIHSTLTARDFFLAYFYPSGPFTCIFSKNLSQFWLCWLWLTHGSCVGPQNRRGHPAGGRFSSWVPAEYK